MGKFILISDESGDTGPIYKKLASRNYLTTCFLIDETYIKQLIDIAHESSKLVFGYSLCAWKDLKGVDKKNYDKLNNFINIFFNKIKEQNFKFLLSIAITDKGSFISGIKKLDHNNIVYYANERSYELIFKRVLPFVDKLNRKLSYANINNFIIEWYIDTNDGKFINILKNSALNILTQLKIHTIQNLEPNFITKKDNRRELVHLIRLADLLGGIVNKTYEYYQLNCLDCRESQCLPPNFNCSNALISAWDTIKSKGLFQDIKARPPINFSWQWRGLIISPPVERHNSNRFFGNDEFFKI
ncbi:MAG: hypothetical protein ACYCTB_11330 [bacterium]